MKGLTQKIDIFERSLIDTALNVFEDAYYECIRKEIFFLKSRIKITNDLFIDIYYNPRNDRQNFALIRNGKRIFGYDNLDSWHYHPFESPEKHIKCSKPKLDKIWSEMKKYIQLLKH